MIVDTSAVVAVVRQEPEAEQLVELLSSDGPHRMSAATRVELGVVLGKAMDESAVDRLLDAFGIEVVPLTAHQARLASTAHRRFGRGNHPAKLNLGDTYSYALAADTAEPLLCIGNDLAQTDLHIRP